MELSCCGGGAEAVGGESDSMLSFWVFPPSEIFSLPVLGAGNTEESETDFLNKFALVEVFGQAEK